MEVYLHPDNLVKNQCYRIFYKGRILEKSQEPQGASGGNLRKEPEGAEFLLLGRFKYMMLAYHGTNSGKMTKKILMLVFHKFGEEFPRLLEWRNILRVEEVSKEEESYKKAE